MSENKYYILNPDHSVKVVLLMEWAEWFESTVKERWDTPRRVAQTNINDEVNVSTVFLGLDYRFWEGPPLIFETMIFGGEHDQYQERYSTWNEAVSWHKRAVSKAKFAASWFGKTYYKFLWLIHRFF